MGGAFCVACIFIFPDIHRKVSGCSVENELCGLDCFSVGMAGRVLSGIPSA